MEREKKQEGGENYIMKNVLLQMKGNEMDEGCNPHRRMINVYKI